MTTTFGALIPVFGLILLGVVIDRLRLLPTGSALVFNQWVFKFSLPSLIFVSFALKRPQELLRAAYMSGTLLGMVAAFALTYGLFKILFRHTHRESGIWSLLSAFPNTSFLGLPVLVAIFPGNSDVVLASAISTVLSLPLLMVVSVILEYDKAKNGADASQQSALRKVGLAMLRHPLVLATAAGAAVCFLGIPLPDALARLFTMISVTTSPCSLVAIGMVLSAQIILHGSQPDHTPAARTCLQTRLRFFCVNLMKLAIQPIVTYLLLRLTGESGAWLVMGVILAAMPTGTVVYVVSENYQACTRESSMTILINTLLSVLTIPLTITILESFHKW